eukprot:TRINITY_DN60826_c0_g1_i2.p1 TRINITY_DN60826_c0_g1~~TRINITY_DN60826_c0_g1_i2.p1  ORF type:complete len:423 (-),score=32.41 TRINITY_DN60826_c0_g1_i2:36-1304(-)
MFGMRKLTAQPEMQRALSMRSKVRAWSFYTALGFVAITVVVVGLTIEALSREMGFGDAMQLRSIFLGRMSGALVGTLAGGWLCDVCPMKTLMSTFFVISAGALVMVPWAAERGLTALVCNFAIIGFVGSGLVCCATTAACWAFPRERVGPVLSGCSASFGITSAALPLLFYPLQNNVRVSYLASAICVLPALMLLCISSAPVKPPTAGFARQHTDGSVNVCLDWTLAVLAGTAQLVLQGSNASMLVWLVPFGQTHLGMGEDAAFLVSAMQGSATLGSLAAMSYQKRFKLLDLACLQLALVTVSAFVWAFAFAQSVQAAVLSVMCYGALGGSTLGYCSALFNQYTTPSGMQLSLISLGSNVGAGLAPFLAGLVMERFGQQALLWLLAIGNGIVFIGMAALRLRLLWKESWHRHDDLEERLLAT